MAFKMEMEVLRNRRLLWLFVKRDLKLRYAGSILGLFWSVINPLIMLTIYVTVIGFILGGGRFVESGDAAIVGRGKEEFAIYLCCGLFSWTCLCECLMGASSSILSNASLIKKSVFPIHILPFQAIASAFVNFFITLILFLICLAILQFGLGKPYLSPIALLLPLLIVFHFLFIVGSCLIVATLNVFFRDTQQLLNAMLMIGFWLTPIIYPVDILTRMEEQPGAEPVSGLFKKGFELWCQINPCAHLVGLYQSVFVYFEFPRTGSIIYLLSFGAVTYIIGKYLFTRSQAHFVDDV